MITGLIRPALVNVCKHDWKVLDFITYNWRCIFSSLLYTESDSRQRLVFVIVLKADGNSDHFAHAQRNKGIPWWYFSNLGLFSIETNAFNRSNYRFNTWVPKYEEPGYINTIDFYMPPWIDGQSEFVARKWCKLIYTGKCQNCQM